MTRSADRRWLDARRAVAHRMLVAAELVRRRPEALDTPTREALAELLELIGTDAVASTGTKTWDAVSRIATRLLELERAPDEPGRPLPVGYENPFVERDRERGL